jgi:hypothetical protein
MKARLLLATSAATALLAGCGGGGDDGPTAGERRAAMARWVERADEACRRAATEIAKLGEPIDVVDIDRVVVRAKPHVERAFTTLERLRTPPGGERRVRPFREALEDLKLPLRSIAEASEVQKVDELLEATTRLRALGGTFERRAREAGLRVCGRSGDRYKLTDAIVAPIFTFQYGELQTSLLGRVKQERKEANLTSRAGFAAYLRAFADEINVSAIMWDKLEPPMRSADEAQGYQDILFATRDMSERAARQAKRPSFTLDDFRALQRRFDDLERRERRAARRLLRSVRPRPADDAPKKSNPVDPDGEQEA